MRKKIAIFLFNLGGGGAERMLTEYSHHSSHDITFLVHQRVQNEYKHKGTVIDFGLQDKAMGKLMTSFMRTLTYLYQQKPDVVVSCLRYINILVITAYGILKILGQLKQTKLVVRIAHVAETKDRTFKSKLLAPLYSLFPHTFITLSKELGQRFATRFSIPPQSIAAIPNGTDLTFVPAKKVKAEDVFDIVTIGRFVKQKNHSLIIKAAEYLVKAKNFAQFRIGIIGKGRTLYEKLEHEIKERHVEKQVKLVDGSNWEYAQTMLFASKIFVLSSDEEGFPNVVLEGMRAGCAIISTDCPTGPKEILDSGKFGILTKVNDPKELAEAMHLLLTDTKLLHHYQTQAKIRAKNYDIKEIAKQYDTLFTTNDIQ